MSTYNINCLGQCLKSSEGDDQIPHKFRNKKGKKCLTLVRKGQNTSLYNTVDTKQTSKQTALNNYQQIKTYQPIHNHQLTERLSLNQHNHIIYGRYSEATEATNRFYVPPPQLLPTKEVYARRERRLSDLSHHYQPIRLREMKVRSNSSEVKSQTLLYNQVLNLGRNIKTQNSAGFEVIKQQQNVSQKRSSLFQGAKSILSKLQSSIKKPQFSSRKEDLSIKKQEKYQFENYIFQTQQKGKTEQQMRLFYNNVRFCETQHAINNTHSTIKTQNEGPQFLTRQMSIDNLPMSPKSKPMQKYKYIKTGKLLGVGKWAHVYLCQEVHSNFLYSIKEIFKNSLQHSMAEERINNTVRALMSISHPNLISLYSKFENEDKICLISQYCIKPLYDQLKVRGQLTLMQIKKYLTGLIEGVVFLHQNDITHGNISIFGVFLNFEECKLKLSINSAFEQDSKSLDFENDITNLAIIAFQMAYGINSSVLKQQTTYQREKLYGQRQSKAILIDGMKRRFQMEQSNSQYKFLNSFIEMLLNWNLYTRLTSNICLNHPFFVGCSNS